ncbi:MAG TPA: tRNA (guanosine(46)-N7)-methyltransferase TrmB [Thermoanaerobaculia bacterium]
MRNQGSTKEAAGRFPGAQDEELWFGRALDARAVFGRTAPLEIEIGTGKARFLLESARAHPERDYLGLERALAYYRICRERVARSGLANARVLRADGRTFVETALAPSSVRAFHIYFPDPWPKKRQKKRRLLDGVFLELAASRLEPGGLLRITTDHPDYGSGLGSLVETVISLERLAWEDLPAPPPTHYELKYASEGRPIWRFLLRRSVAEGSA